MLVTCPPMLQGIDAVRETAAEMSMSLTTPKVVQTLTEDELIDQLRGHDGWIIGDDPATARVVGAAKELGLKAAVKWGIGVDNVDLAAFKEAGIPVINTPNMFGDEVADLAMCYLIGLARCAFRVDRDVRSGKWPKPAGSSLRGKIVGVVGMGDVGAQFAIRANASGMRIIAWDPYVSSCPNNVELMGPWPAGLETCDFLVLTCALTPQTYHLFGTDILAHIKPGLRVINVSRGSLINESVLIEAMIEDLVSCAALDVFEFEPLSNQSRLLDFENCVLGTHNASNTKDAVRRASIAALARMQNFLEAT